MNGGKPIAISIETRTGSIVSRVWQLQVGRNTLLLLDSDVEGNQPEDRELTARLYGGDERVRIRQELLLGVGGVRALTRWASRPASCTSTKAIARLRSSRWCGIEWRPKASTPGKRFAACPRMPCSRPIRRCRPATTVFRQLIDEHLGPLRESLGISHEELMGSAGSTPAIWRRRSA